MNKFSKEIDSNDLNCMYERSGSIIRFQDFFCSLSFYDQIKNSVITFYCPKMFKKDLKHVWTHYKEVIKLKKKRGH